MSRDTPGARAVAYRRISELVWLVLTVNTSIRPPVNVPITVCCVDCHARAQVTVSCTGVSECP
jgi:hypothetical protein